MMYYLVQSKKAGATGFPTFLVQNEKMQAPLISATQAYACTYNYKRVYTHCQHICIYIYVYIYY